MDDPTDRLRGHIETLWRFHARGDAIDPMDAVVCLGSYDLRVAERAADLALAYPAAAVVVTGAQGNWTRGLFEETEAEVFGRAILQRGVPAERIMLEPRATNIGENLTFARDLLAARAPRTTVFVTKPQTQMRVRATLPIRWPGIDGRVTAPLLSIDDYRSPDLGLAPLVDEMVGDLQRMLTYAQTGLQVPVDIADSVLAAFETLKAAGFTHHMPKA